MVYLRKTEAADLRANPEEIKSHSKHREVPKEDAVVEPVKGRKTLHRARNQAAGRLQKLKVRTRENCRSRRNLVAARRWKTHVQKWHSAKDTSFRDKARIRFPRRDGRSGRENVRARKAAREQRT
jgi:hypothetical protein